MKNKIMIVDDSKSMRVLIKSTLVNAGYTVTTGVDGADALIKLKKSSVDLVVTDLDMPNMGGLDLIKKLREIPAFKFIPIIILTTVSQRKQKTKGKQAGATCWITKPFKPSNLVKLIKKTLK
jgi:two-component system chemotaxis response regulator CheY